MENKDAAKIIDDVINGFAAFANRYGMAKEYSGAFDTPVLICDSNCFKALNDCEKEGFIAIVCFTHGILTFNKKYIPNEYKELYRWIDDFYKGLKEFKKEMSASGK